MKRTLIAALLASAFPMTALAGDCPADQRRPDGSGQKMVKDGPKDVTDRVIASNDLSKDPIALKGRLFRARELVVAPGGVVPWHDHGNRPAMIYIVSGEIHEYASTCAAPILHKAGEVAAEKAPTQHWWKNNGKQKAVLISVDLFPAEMKMDEHMM
ncbi:MAG: cupin domain-containing protein [Burkholderiales bacterium]|nr:cupin domain-containing protein [Burkholderiales bacterium]